MAMETQLNGFSVEMDKKNISAEAEQKEIMHSTNVSSFTKTKSKNGEETGKENTAGAQKEKELAQSTLESAMSNMNSRMKKTRCEYDFDDPTNTITVKVYDKDTGDLIREVPPEKSLEAIKKIWEIAGLIVDEKR